MTERRRSRQTLEATVPAGPRQHMNAKVLHQRATQASVGASLATIHNTLNQCREARLVRDLTIAAPRAYFDTDTVDHHCFLLEDEQPVNNIPWSSNCRKRVARSAQITRIDPAVRMTKRMGQDLPVQPHGRAIWKPRRPSSHIRHTFRVDAASAQTEKPCLSFLLKEQLDDHHEEGSLRYLSHACSR
ncbi:hypothetical protein EOD23_02525 [Mesorhizobium sp. USDA-HM6]|nr:hypothetical protein EOD23_02525 [Mesorhizobium sp. USDA-HM6]